MGVKIDVELDYVLKLVDDFLKKEADKLVNYIKNGTSINRASIFFADKPKSIDGDESVFKENIDANSSGVYVFVVTEPVTLKRDEFNKVAYASPMKENFNGKFLGNDTLYVGKSENEIYKRVNSHIVNNVEKTYLLRLNDKYRKKLYKKTKVYVFVLKEEYQKYAKMIVASVEGYLHKNLEPKVGTKRT